MNAPVSFDTLAFVRKLEDSGMAARQAEALAEALGDIVFKTTATKSDLRELELRLEARLRELELRLTSSLTVKLGTAIGASTALTVAILGALISFH